MGDLMQPYSERQIVVKCIDCSAVFVKQAPNHKRCAECGKVAAEAQLRRLWERIKRQREETLSPA